MYTFANLTLVASFIAALLAIGHLAVRLPFAHRYTTEALQRHVTYVSTVQWVLTGLMTLSCLVLLYAFVICDFRLEYVQDYSSLNLAIFYRVTAFWAGKPGSLLFWAWTVALSGLVFLATPTYKKFSPITQGWFWCFFFSIMAFFLFLLITWNDPFVMVAQPLKDGYGLNPLLQNPGMIFHPPLLFLGYGGFVIPGCLALAQATANITIASTSEAEPHWAKASRPFTLVAWAMLTAGIVLGAWWAYMELGWGGYWAWDPVENASLIPWLAATAYLHTSVIESRRGKLARTNIFFINLTTIAAFFATYLVRSGVVESLHAFGAGGVGMPFLVFMFLYLLLVIAVCVMTPAKDAPLDTIASREGLLLLVSWVMLALTLIILMATLWPVIIDTLISLKPYLPQGLADTIPTQTMGLNASFYNRVCLPIFAILAVLLLICPHLQWNNKLLDKRTFLVVLAGALLLIPALWYAGVTMPLALITASAGFAALVGLIMLFAGIPQLLKSTNTLLAHGVHLGLLLIIIGVAFSGPYQVKNEFILGKGQRAQAGKYTFTVEEIYRGNSRLSPQGVPYYSFHEVKVRVDANGAFAGYLSPQMRRYAGYEKQNYPEVSTLFSLRDELYATFTGLDNQNNARLEVNINPLVNWLWVGGTLMSLFPFLVFWRRKHNQE